MYVRTLEMIGFDHYYM